MSVNSEPILITEVADNVSGSQDRDKIAGDSSSAPRIALLSPYSGNNYGDAAILDSLIASLRHRLPDAQFSGITFNCEHFLARHGTRAFPLCGVNRSFHCMARAQGVGEQNNTDRPSSRFTRIKASFTSLPLIGPFFRWVRNRAGNLFAELRHGIRGYRFLRSHDCVIVAGGGQLDDEWGGPWGHPFALFKWTLLAQAARVPIAFASVGACKIDSRWSSFFLRSALRKASYRSYRDPNSRGIAANLLGWPSRDIVVPDLAFSPPKGSMAIDGQVLELAQRRKVIAISPMIYMRPDMWPRAEAAVYSRYLRELAQAIFELQARGYFIVVVRSTSSDRTAVEELRELAGQGSESVISKNLFVPRIDSWRDLVAILRQVDIVIASRLHSIILSFTANKPAIALSFDSKVDWAMSDLAQDSHRLDIRRFEAADVVQAIDRLEAGLQTSDCQIESFNSRARAALALQADALAALVQTHMQITH